MASHVASYLADELAEDRIERRSLSGSRDRGDVGGVRLPLGGRVVVEVKDHGGEVQVGNWLGEAEVERGNDDAIVGLVVFKRKGISLDEMGDQGVLMTLADLAALLRGGTD